MDQELGSGSWAGIESYTVVIGPGVSIAVSVHNVGVLHVRVWSSVALVRESEGSGTAVFISWMLGWHVLSVWVAPVTVSQDSAW